MKYWFIFCLFTLPLIGRAQDTTVVRREADLMAQATFKGDYETVITYAYPKLVELSGGKEAMQQLITDRVAALKQQGILSIEGTVGSPGKFYKAGEEVHCLLPEELIIKTSVGRYRGHSWLLGISKDNGISWTFLDVGNMPSEILHKLLPNYNNELIIPPPVKPEFLPD